MDFFGKFWDYSGSVLGHFWTIFRNCWEIVGKCSGSFGNIFGTILEFVLEKLNFHFFRIKKIFRYPKYFLTDVFFNFLHPVYVSNG